MFAITGSAQNHLYILERLIGPPGVRHIEDYALGRDLSLHASVWIWRLL